MIIKARSINSVHAKNTLVYVDKEEKDHLFLAADGVDISSVRSMMKDFSLYKSSRVKKAFVSTVISPSVEDNLDQKGMEKLLLKIQQELGLDNRQYYAVIHQNTKTPHIHLISNRIDFDGKVWNDHHVAWTCQTVCKKICKDLKLTSAADRKGKYESKKLDEKSEFHTKRAKTIKEIKKYFNEIKYKAISIDHVFDYLESKGVDVKVTPFKKRLWGVSLELNGSKFKATEIDRLLSIIPKDESYSANPKMQLIIDNNLARFEERRGSKEILQDLRTYPDRQSEFALELTALNLFFTENRNDQNRRKYEEDKEKYLAQKYGKRAHQLGFKVQI